MSVGDAHTILVVDDDDALAEMIGLVLAQEGFNAVFCENGARAFETFMRSTPDLVLLDLMLPGMNGIEVCQQIRRSSNVPIIMLTAKDSELDKVFGRLSMLNCWPASVLACVRVRAVSWLCRLAILSWIWMAARSNTTTLRFR